MKGPSTTFFGPKHTDPSGTSVTVGVDPEIGGGGAAVGIGVKKTF